MLREIEKEHDVRILYACESGSRAWGFPSQDSDYDVRFVYVHPAAWYLSVETGRDVIELPLEGDLDINGWDLRKTLGLLRKSNPPLLEKLRSPIVYVQSDKFLKGIRKLAQDCFSVRNCVHHYLNMAEGNRQAYLREERVLTKKYFYVLRPVLACLWLEKGLGPVPMEFSCLVDEAVVDSRLRLKIAELLGQKAAGMERDKDVRIPEFDSFFEAEIPRLKAVVEELPVLPRIDVGKLDEFFRSFLPRIDV